MRSLLKTVLFLAILFVASSGIAQENTLTSIEEKEDWVLLFDGVSVDAWRGYNKQHFPRKGWAVRDGELVVLKSGTEEEGFGGDIVTKEQFGSFELTLEFMLTDSANSGIFYLVREFEGTPIWHNAPEYQLLDDEAYFQELGDWMDTHRTGDNYDLHAADSNYSKPIGEWNTARIVKKGNSVEHWLNGYLTVQYEISSIDWVRRVQKSKFNEYPMYGKAGRGHIGLQDHGHEVRFRNIKIRRL